jgi:DNA polymerase III delta prime subunit
LLKEVAQTQQVDLSAKQRFKVVVINEADQLTRDAQAALRRTMEKYSPNLRLILLANSTANIIAPIRSRTLLVRVAAPSENEICNVLQKVGKLEKFKEVEGLNQRIAKESGRNLRKALLMFEAVYAQKYGILLSLVAYLANQCTATISMRKLRFRPLTGKHSSLKLRMMSSQSVHRQDYYKSGQSSMICSVIAYLRQWF